MTIEQANEKIKAALAVFGIDWQPPADLRLTEVDNFFVTMKPPPIRRGPFFVDDSPPPFVVVTALGYKLDRGETIINLPLPGSR